MAKINVTSQRSILLGENWFVTHF